MRQSFSSGGTWFAMLAACTLASAGCESGEDGSAGPGGTGGDGGEGGASTASSTSGSGATGGAGGATGGTGGSGAASSFSEVMDVLITGGCTNGYCHGGGSGTMTLSADPEVTYLSLVDQPAGGVSCKPGAMTRVVPGDPENSLLWQKIAPGVTPCGSKMPPESMGLNEAQVETVRGWIAAGAPK